MLDLTIFHIPAASSLATFYSSKTLEKNKVLRRS
jgi:hypothetical protein